MNEEIAGGLKNALERGSSIEEAVASFINAGYNPLEVKEASNSLTMGATTMMPIEKGPSMPPQSNYSVPVAPPEMNIPEKKKSKWPIVAIIFLLILVAFILVAMLLGEDILALFK